MTKHSIIDNKKQLFCICNFQCFNILLQLVITSK